MKVRIIKPIISSYGGFHPGTAVDIPDSVGETWCRVGIVMQEKSLDGATETKAKPIPPLPPPPETNTAEVVKPKAKGKVKIGDKG